MRIKKGFRKLREEIEENIEINEDSDIPVSERKVREKKIKFVRS